MINGKAHAGMRKAALLLSSLREQDRAWLLSRVDEHDRRLLEELLSELRALGVALDAAAVKEILRVGAKAAPVPEDTARPIEAASARGIFEVLAPEPDWLIAAVLRARPWTWREPFLQLLGTERRLRVQRARPAGAPRPHALEALACAIEKRLAELPPEDRSEPEPRPAARLPRRLFRRGAIRKFWSETLSWRR